MLVLFSELMSDAPHHNDVVIECFLGENPLPLTAKKYLKIPADPKADEHFTVHFGRFQTQEFSGSQSPHDVARLYAE